MRKQDRIAAEQRRPQEGSGESPQSEPRSQEEIKGSASPNPLPKPQRQPGKLPLPD